MSLSLCIGSNHVCPSHQVPSAKQNLRLLLGARVLSHLPGATLAHCVQHIPALPPEVRDLVAAALSGQTCVALERIELSHALDYGGLAVLREAWQRFGLEKLFAEVPLVRQRRLLQAMIFGRIIFPCAKLALVEQASGTLLASACGLCQQSETLDEDDLYEAMDGLNGRWVPIEKQLYTEAFAQGVSLVLHDLTSVYFEGKGPQGLGAYGYSRDHRGGLLPDLVGGGHRYPGRAHPSGGAARKSGRYDDLTGTTGQAAAALWYSAGNFCL